MLIPSQNGDGAAFARHDVMLDALRHALQARFVTDSAKTLERLRRAVAGRYEVEEELGRGAMGIVYLGYDPRLERPIAIKVLAPELASRRLERDRFLREARTAARLSHPNIVPIHSVEDAGDFVFFTMEYLEGVTLADWVIDRGPLPVGEATWILHDVARGVGYAHARGVIHRDLKPDNVLIDSDSGRAMVMDFGIARVESEPDLDREGYVLGTAPFISPERVTGGPGDERSDVYALGVTAYFAVTGTLPFDGETVGDILRQHAYTPAPTLHLHGEHLDTTFARAVERCLEKDPNQRFPDGDDLADALAHAPEIRGRELPVPLEAFVARLHRLSRSTRGLSVLAGAAVILLLDGVVRADWAAAGAAAGFLALVAAAAGRALLPTLRRVFRAGYRHADIVHALSVDLERDREVTRFEHGNVSTRPSATARRLAYAGLGLAGAGAILSLVPIVDPVVGLGAMGVGFVLAFGGAITGLVFGRRLSRPGRMWLAFWRSRLGEWTARLAEARREEIPLEDVRLDAASAQRIREWVERDD